MAIRLATAADAEPLITLRAVMFGDMGTTTDLNSWQGPCRQILVDGLTAGDLIGGVAEADGGTVVASGIATLRRWLPGPSNPSGLTGYIGSMSTLGAWRRHGIARRITELLIAELTTRGAVDIELHATESGEGVYRSLGFIDRSQAALTMHTQLDAAGATERSDDR